MSKDEVIDTIRSYYADNSEVTLSEVEDKIANYYRSNPDISVVSDEPTEVSDSVTSVKPAVRLEPEEEVSRDEVIDTIRSYMAGNSGITKSEVEDKIVNYYRSNPDIPFQRNMFQRTMSTY